MAFFINVFHREDPANRIGFKCFGLWSSKSCLDESAEGSSGHRGYFRHIWITQSNGYFNEDEDENEDGGDGIVMLVIGMMVVMMMMLHRIRDTQFFKGNAQTTSWFSDQTHMKNTSASRETHSCRAYP